MSDTNATTESKTYEGSCHCSMISFTVTVSPPLEKGHKVTSCNCSICLRNGYLLIYVPKKSVNILSGEKETQEYSFGLKRIGHQFCPRCGSNVWADSLSPDFYPDFKAINVRTLKDIDIDHLTLNKIDGKSYGEVHTETSSD